MWQAEVHYFKEKVREVRMKRQERSARLVLPSDLLPLCELGLSGLGLWTFYTLQACMAPSGDVAAAELGWTSQTYHSLFLSSEWE